jgi:hypothetical protein
MYNFEQIKADLELMFADPLEELPEVITIYLKSYLKGAEEEVKVIELESE